MMVGEWLFWPCGFLHLELGWDNQHHVTLDSKWLPVWKALKITTDLGRIQGGAWRSVSNYKSKLSSALLGRILLNFCFLSHRGMVKFCASQLWWYPDFPICGKSPSPPPFPGRCSFTSFSLQHANLNKCSTTKYQAPDKSLFLGSGSLQY